MLMENKAREAEQMVTRLVEESERRRQEADELKKEVDFARDAERLAKDKLMSFLSNASLSPVSSETALNNSATIAGSGGSPVNSTVNLNYSNAAAASSLAVASNGNVMSPTNNGNNHTNGFQIHQEYIQHYRQQMPFVGGIDTSVNSAINNISITADTSSIAVARSHTLMSETGGKHWLCKSMIIFTNHILSHQT